MIIIGADPGLSGAIAALDTETNQVTVLDMPVTKDTKGRTVIDPYTLFEALRPPAGVQCRAVVEHVHAMPQQGVSSSFLFGEGYGALKMAIAAHAIPVQFVTPHIWKKHFGLSSDKGLSRGLASNRFPANAKDFALVKHDGRAEAVLLAVYGQEKLVF